MKFLPLMQTFAFLLPTDKSATWPFCDLIFLRSDISSFSREALFLSSPLPLFPSFIQMLSFFNMANLRGGLGQNFENVAKK